MQGESLKLFLGRDVKLIVREGAAGWVELGRISQVDVDTVILETRTGTKLIDAGSIIKCETQNGGGLK